MKVISWATLSEWIDIGFGRGHFEQYQAFLRITRRAFPRRSNQVVGVMPGFKRRFDFWSRAERLIALLCIWLGVRDLREQYPLWPWAHDHPLADWPLYALRYDPAPALLEIARDAGIDHGNYFGSPVPYVATTDLLVTVGTDTCPELVAIACKPRELLWGRRAKHRVVERLELERRYFKALGVRHVVADSAAIDSVLSANLQALAPDKTLLTRLDQFQERGAAEESLRRRLQEEALRDAVWATARDLRCDLTLIWGVFQMLVWRQEIDLDLSRPMVRSLPMVVGGRRRRAALRKAWLGEAGHD